MLDNPKALLELPTWQYITITSRPIEQSRIYCSGNVHRVCRVSELVSLDQSLQVSNISQRSMRCPWFPRGCISLRHTICIRVGHSFINHCFATSFYLKHCVPMCQWICHLGFIYLFLALWSFGTLCIFEVHQIGTRNAFFQFSMCCFC